MSSYSVSFMLYGSWFSSCLRDSSGVSHAVVSYFGLYHNRLWLIHAGKSWLISYLIRYQFVCGFA